MQKLNIYIICFLLSSVCYAQTERQLLYKGNQSYFSGKTMEAANLYKKSLKEKQTYYKANFNLGDALYKTAYAIKAGKAPIPDKKMTKDSAASLIFEQAAEQFEVVAKSVLNNDTIQRAWHNYGNAKLFQSNFEDAIYGYKKALRINPKDEDTRYNLAFAQRELKKQQEQQKKNEKKDEKKDDKKDGDKKEDKKDKGEKDKEDINNKNDKEKQEAAQPKMSKEQAEKMLNALKNDEKKMQAMRKKKGEPGSKKKVEKDW